jgi:hypothetical protein
VGSIIVDCSPLLRVRARCPAEPQHSFHLAGTDTRHRVRAGRWFRHARRKGCRGQVLKTDSFETNQIDLPKDNMDMHNQLDELLEELADVEKQQEDKTLSHSDQQLLDQAWEDLNDQIAYLQEIIEMAQDADWGGEEEPIQTEGTIYVDDEEDKRVGADYYETDFGVYYEARDEV